MDGAVYRLLEKHARGRDFEGLIIRRHITEQERNRLFAHGKHEESIFYSRLNFFLVCESFALTVVVNTAGRAHGLTPSAIRLLSFTPSAIRLLSFTGIGTALLWLFVQHKKLQLLHILEARCTDALPEFEETIKMLRFVRRLQLSATTLLAYLLPSLFLFAWFLVMVFLT
jgi:hypothetical protein